MESWCHLGDAFANWKLKGKQGDIFPFNTKFVSLGNGQINLLMFCSLQLYPSKRYSMSSIMMIDIPNALEVVERKKSTWSIFPPFSIVSNHPSSPPVKIPSFPSLVFSEINFHCEQSSTILIFRSHIKHRKSAKLPWHHNIILSFCPFVFTSLWSNVWRISRLKSHSLCPKS